MGWTNMENLLPPEEEFVDTKISDDKGERNFQQMKRRSNLWFTRDGLYVLYTDTLEAS